MDMSADHGFGGPRGSGRYAAYHALWHLVEIGVVEDLKTFASPAWDAAQARIDGGATPTRIAMIDTSVAADHPNLRGAVDPNLSFDLCVDPMGRAEFWSGAKLSALVAEAKGSANPPPGLPVGLAETWRALLDHLEAASGDDGAADPVFGPSFAAHGTAMAGLIGARPLGVGEVEIAGIATAIPPDASIPASDLVGFAYSGVDPFCEIVPIATHFDVEPDSLVLALLHALVVKADIVVLARDFPDPRALFGGLADGEGGGIAFSEAEIAKWDLLKELVLAISERVPVICAAGNDGSDELLYPACLAKPENGIVAVGARSAAGQLSGYTPTADVTVYAPSGDGERLDEAMQRLDVLGPGYRPDDQSASFRDRLRTFDAAGADPVPDAWTHAPQDLVSTDVPGRAGNNASPYSDVFGQDGAVLDYRSAFCRFSGTSGAVALTAGLISLGRTAGLVKTGTPGDGSRIKAALCSGGGDPTTATPALHWSAF
jgi:hypothetical protein